jgi:hypothetical protein
VRSRAAIALAAVLCAACSARGPFFEHPLQLPRPTRGARRLVVADLYYQDPVRPYGQRRDASAGPVPVPVVDLGPAVAKQLNKQDLPAEARAHATPDSLDPGDLLVRGFVLMHHRERQGDAQLVLSLLTAGIYGGLLPFAPPIDEICLLRIHLDLVAADGAVTLRHRGDDQASFRHDSLWSMGGNYCHAGNLADDLAVRIAEALHSLLRGRMPAPMTVRR